MSSRQEQKEKRRKEREERERAEANAAKRKRLAQMAGGAIIVVAIIVGVVLAVSGGGGGSNSAGDAADGAAPAALKIPPQRQTDLQVAAKAAGCVAKDFPNEGQNHVTSARTPSDYKTNPPTSGDHNPIPASDGFYAAATPPDLKNWVHSLEHGRIQIQYKPGTPITAQRQLRSVFNESVAGGPARYHMMMFQNNTGMPFQVAAVAWRHYLGCPKMDAQVFDAIRTFRDKYVDQAPEQIPGKE